MADVDAFDDVRYEHHLKHRGRGNQHLAQCFWVGVCCTVALIGARRVFVWCARRCNRQPPRSQRFQLPTHLDRSIAFFRAVTLLSIQDVSAIRLLTLLAYGSTIAVLLTWVNAPIFSTHFFDDVAFRAAWITVTQVPLVYFLSTKRGPLNLLTGISHRRINWLHRWTGRVLFICATTHMAIMVTSISIIDLIKSPNQPMSVVRYGAGAYATLAWIVVSSLLPLRRCSYRAFHINHYICTLIFLGLIATHVPSYARLPIYASFAIVAMDKSLCAFKFLSNNITIRPSDKKTSSFKTSFCRQVLAMGYPVKMMTPFITKSSVCPDEIATVIRISDVPFLWKPGQHVRLYLPKLGALEMHPFTPATCSDASESQFLPSKYNNVEHYGLLPNNTTSTANDMLFIIKAHSGLTKRLSNYHAKWLVLPCPNASQPSSSLTAYIDGPYGDLPAWEEFENIIVVASSTGVTFLLSILHYLEQLCCDGRSHSCTQQIRFVWANRHIEPQFEATVADVLSRHTTMLRESDVKIDAEFYTTCEEAEDQEVEQHDPFAHLRRPHPNFSPRRPPLRIRNPNAPLEEVEEEWYQEEEVEHSLERFPAPASGTSMRSSCETYVSSTLVGDDSDELDFDSRMEVLNSSCWSRMPSLRRWRPQKAIEIVKTCHCAHLRHEQCRFKKKNLPSYISRSYGRRPDLTSIFSTSVPRTETRRTMVAVCSNQGMTSKAISVVSKMNMEFARGRREAGVEIHTEGFR